MDKIKANLIVEIMGRPPEHIKETLNTLVVKMGSDQGVSLIDKKYHKPKKVKDAENLFSAFAEINVEFDTLDSFYGTVFNYMPANVEVYEPEKLNLHSYDLNTSSNFILTRLHHYDSIAKNLVGERNILLQQIEALKQKGIKMDVLDSFREKAEERLNLEKNTKAKKIRKTKGKKTKKKKN